MCVKSATAFLQLFSSFLPQGALTLGTNPLIIREPERRGDPFSRHPSASVEKKKWEIRSFS